MMEERGRGEMEGERIVEERGERRRRDRGEEGYRRRWRWRLEKR